MIRTFLRSKIHRATVTEANLDYQGSITLDRHLINAAALQPFEQVEIYNVNNGERFSTYVIEGGAGSGEVILNGAAAHKVRPGHKIIIASYGGLHEGEILNHRPKLVFVDEKNRVTTLKEAEVARTTA